MPPQHPGGVLPVTAPCFATSLLQHLSLLSISQTVRAVRAGSCVCSVPGRNSGNLVAQCLGCEALNKCPLHKWIWNVLWIYGLCNMRLYIQPLGQFSTLRSVFVQHLSRSDLLTLEAGLRAGFPSPLGPGLPTLCSHWTKAAVWKTLLRLTAAVEDLLRVIHENPLWIFHSKYLLPFYLPSMILGHPTLPLFTRCSASRKAHFSMSPLTQAGRLGEAVTQHIQ